MTDNIFQGTDPVPQSQEAAIVAPVTTPQTPEIPPELAEFVGVGKKYSSLADVHKAFPHAQQHINTLEQENARIKAELDKRKTAEELLNDIQNSLTQAPATTETPTISANDISQLVRAELERKSVEDVAKQNQYTVVQEFTKKFGEKAQAEFERIAADLGVPVTSLNQLASTSPKAVFKLAGIDTSPNATQSGTLQSDVTTVATTTASDHLSARVPLNGGAKDDAAAIARARELIMKQYTK